MMTEYEDKVKNQHLKNQAEDWGNKIRYVHFNDGVEEKKFNSGKSEFTDTKTGKKWTIFPDDAKLSLIDRYTKWLVDRRSEI